MKKTRSNPITESQKRNFIEASKLDKRIPRDLLMQYQGKWYVLKAGLEYKAHLLYKGGNWGITTDIIEKKPDYVLAKATFKTKDGIEFSNYGEASVNNVQNKNMHKYLLHLAVTRAECRVLRMATASAYISAEEMEWYNQNNQQELPASETDSLPITPVQETTLKKLNATEIPKTRGEAKKLIIKLLNEQK